MAGQFEAREARRPDPNEKLVKVFDSEEESEGLVVKGLLDSAGIDSDLMSGSMVQEMFPGLGGMVILVREEDADEAKRVIAESQRAESSMGEGSVSGPLATTTMLLPNCQLRSNRVAVEKETHCAVQIGAIGSDMRSLQALQDAGFR